jgi:hypothetical protein
MEEPKVPIVNPCYICGLPLLREMSQYNPPKNLSWRCNNEKDCTFREYDYYYHLNNGTTYRSLLKGDAHYPWIYTFRVIADENRTTLTICGPWVNSTFNDILTDAFSFARSYDLNKFTIENKAGDILYNGH